MRHIQAGNGEAAQRVDGLGVVAAAADVAVDTIGVGPVRLDGDGVKPFSTDQPLGDLGTLAVELVRAVRRLAQQDEARVADELEERARSPPAPRARSAARRTSSTSAATMGPPPSMEADSAPRRPRPLAGEQSRAGRIRRDRYRSRITLPEKYTCKSIQFNADEPPRDALPGSAARAGPHPSRMTRCSASCCAKGPLHGPNRRTSRVL